MKILIMTWDAYDDRLKEYNKNCTGQALVIRNLCEYIGKKEEVYLFVGRFSLPSTRLEHINIVGTESFAGAGSTMNANARHMEAMVEAFEDTLRTVRPDIVNIHALGDLSLKCVQKCIAWKQPYVFTAHIFINPMKIISGYDRVVKWEKEIYGINGIKVIAVGEGIKRDIRSSFPQIPEGDIQVIKNGTDFKAEIISSDWKEQFGLAEKKILLCVGTIQPRKNQEQLIEAFELLPQSVRDNLAILFCGVDKMKGLLQGKIESAGLKNSLIYAGAFSNEDMKKAFSIADGMIMPSLAEGLSIAALEMIAYGKPVIMFSDVECAVDLNDEKVVCLAQERTSRSLAEAIVQWYEKKWDGSYIKAISKNFTMEIMAENYISHYNVLLSGR